MSLKMSIKAWVLKRFCFTCCGLFQHHRVSFSFHVFTVYLYEHWLQVLRGKAHNPGRETWLGFGWEIPARLSVQAGSDQKGTLQRVLLIVMGFLAQTLEKAVCVFLSRKLLTALYRKGALTRINFYYTAKTCIFQMPKDIAHSIKRLCLDLNSVTLFMCKNHKGYFKSLWGLMHVCALAPKIQDEI